MFNAKMPMEFWAEAVVHAADIRNRFICPRSENKTSYELLSQTKPRVDHIRVFGSLEWAHIAKEKRRKLDPKGNEENVIGCFENGLFKVWIRAKRSSAIYRHMRIFENRFPEANWYGRESTAITDDELIFKNQASVFPESTPKHRGPSSAEGQLQLTHRDSKSRDESNIRERESLPATPLQPSTFCADDTRGVHVGDSDSAKSDT